MEKVRKPLPKDQFKETWHSHQPETKAPLNDSALIRITAHWEQFTVGSRKVNEIHVLEVLTTTQT